MFEVCFTAGSSGFLCSGVDNSPSPGSHQPSLRAETGACAALLWSSPSYYYDHHYSSPTSTTLDGLGWLDGWTEGLDG